MPEGSRWSDVPKASENIGEKLTEAMGAVSNANDEIRGVFTVDWNQPAPDNRAVIILWILLPLRLHKAMMIRLQIILQLSSSIMLYLDANSGGG